MNHDVPTHPAEESSPVTGFHGDADPMLTTRQVAERLGVSLRTVQLWVEAGVLPAARTPGGHRRIRQSAVRELALRTGLGELGVALPTPVPASRAVEVLVIEDQPDLRTLWTHTLDALGENLTLRCADDGYNALLQIGQRKPDLLITDLMMPGLDGLAMLRALRRDSAFDPSRVLAISALGPEDIAARGGLPEGVTLLRKPIAPSAVLAWVEQAIDRLRAHPATPENHS